MLKFNQITYLFSEWARVSLPRVALLVGKIHETHLTQDLGRMYEALETGLYDDYNVITADGEYDDIILLIMKP